jgi:hypothetical protein
VVAAADGRALDVTVQAGDAITFSWQFVAAGGEKCYHDGVEVPLVSCASPMIVVAKAFSANVTSHNFSVVMTDVCGNQKAANWTYTAGGAKAISEVDYVDPNVMSDGANFGVVPATARRTTISAAAPITTAAGLLRSTAAALVASLLLMALLL